MAAALARVHPAQVCLANLRSTAGPRGPSPAISVFPVPVLSFGHAFESSAAYLAAHLVA